MEQQKILWIVFAIALGILVIVGAGFLWFLPKTETQATQGLAQETKPTGSDFDPVEWVRTSNDFPGIEEKKPEEPKGDLSLVYGEKGTEAKKGAEPVIVVKPEEKKATPETTTKVITPVVATKSTPPEKPKTSEEPKPQVKSVPQPPVYVEEYWIQAGSFESRSRAAEAQAALAKSGVQARVTTRDVNGKIFYRLRIGPYANKQEAEKFLEWVKKLDDFEQSYISLVKTQR
jgi:cell division protein FtsN